jgi:hypothetical protein
LPARVLARDRQKGVAYHPRARSTSNGEVRKELTKTSFAQMQWARNRGAAGAGGGV